MPFVGILGLCRRVGLCRHKISTTGVPYCTSDLARPRWVARIILSPSRHPEVAPDLFRQFGIRTCERSERTKVQSSPRPACLSITQCLLAGESWDRVWRPNRTGAGRRVKDRPFEGGRKMQIRLIPILSAP